jgi:hypothetical protein
MDPLDRDIFVLNVVFVSLCGLFILAPILYIYIRRKTAKSRAKISPVVSSGPNPLEPNPSGIDVKPAEPSRLNLPKAKPISPEQRLKVTANVLLILGAASLLNSILLFPVGLVTGEGLPTLLLLIPFIRNLVVGITLLILAFFVRRRSLPALVVALAIFVVNGLLLLIEFTQAQLSNTFLICNSGLFLLTGMYLWSGLKALRELNTSAPDENNQL